MPKDPRSIIISSDNDVLTSIYNQDGWKAKYITISFPIPIPIATSRVRSFYNNLKHLIPGITESTLVAEPKDTVHLGKKGGLWLNIRSENKVLNQDAITQVLNILIDGAESGWAPMFEAEWSSPDSDTVIYVSLTQGLEGEMPGPVNI